MYLDMVGGFSDDLTRNVPGVCSVHAGVCVCVCVCMLLCSVHAGVCTHAVVCV